MKTLQVKVRPNARTSVLEAPAEDNIWSARLKSPPLDGKANQELIKLVAGYFGCSRGPISIKRGVGTRLKLVLIDDT